MIDKHKVPLWCSVVSTDIQRVVASMSHLSDTWRGRLTATSITVCLAWVLWSSSSIVALREAQAADEVRAVSTGEMIREYRDLKMTVSNMDVKLNLLLLSKGIDIPEPQRSKH